MSCHAVSTEISKGPRIIRAGLIKRFKKGFLSKGFKVVYAELTDDSYFLWYRDQSSYKREGAVLLSSICDFLAVGPYTRSIPGRPNLPKGASERHIIAIPSTPSRDSTVHWFLCFNDNELNDWMTSISSVLPPLPPPSDPPPESADLKDPPPPYPGGLNDSEIKPPSCYVATEVKKAMNGDLAKSRQPSANKCETVTKDDVVIATAAAGSAAVNAWGWTWGWGGGWGCGGWGCFDFGPNPMSHGNQMDSNCMDMNDGMDLKNGGGDVHQNTNECGMSSDQVTDYADYDGPDIDPGYDVMCDGGFDAGFDAGGFDMGFSIGF